MVTLDGWRNMCLAVCGVLVMLAAHSTQGIPVLQRITPTARLLYRPSTPMFPYRKSFRSWAKKQHEDLWMGAPSGDGPTDQWESLSERTLLPQSTVEDYTTRSPTLEDIYPSLSDPFPTVIDTSVETSEAFSDEVLTRRSLDFEGPSSLLNTFIFRPSLSEDSPSYIAPTPSMIMSSLDVQAEFDLSASWTDREDFESSFTMSSRQALSDFPSDVYAIITAISATHIYREDSLPTDWSSFTFVPSEASLMERFPDSSDDLSHFQSDLTSVSVHLLSSYYTDLITNASIDWQENTRLYPNSQILFSTDILPRNISSSVTKSAFSSDVFLNISDNGYPTTFVEATFLHWSPLTTPIDAHASSQNIETNYFNDISMISSSPNSIHFLSPSDIIPFFTTYDTFLLNTVETTVTIIDNKQTPFTFILPTLTVSGTSFNKATEHLSKLVYDLTSSSSIEELNYEMFSNFSSFKHLSSSFNTETIFPFNAEESVNTLTQLPESPSQDVSFDSSYKIQQTEQTVLFSSSKSSYYFKNTSVVDSDNEILTSSISLFAIYPFPETELNRDLSIQGLTTIDSEYEEISTKSNENQPIFNTVNIDSSKYDIQSQKASEYRTKETLSKLDYVSSEVALQNISLETIIPEISSSVRTSFVLHEEQNINPSLRKSTEYLDNEILQQTQKLDNDFKSSRQSLKSELDDWNPTLNSLEQINVTLLTQNNSNYEYFETSTHHVTYRSLRETLDFDNSEYETGGIYTKTLQISLACNDTSEHILSYTLQSIPYALSESSFAETIISPHYPLQQTSAIIEKLTISYTISSINDEDYTGSLWHDPKNHHVLEKSSIGSQMSTQTLETSDESDFSALSKIPTPPLQTSSDYLILSTSVLDDYTQSFSDVENYFLESSNISSKSLEEHILQSPIIQGSGTEIYESSIEGNILSSEDLESSFRRFWSSLEDVSLMASPTINIPISFLESGTFNFQAISETHFDDSSEVVDEHTKVDKPATFLLSEPPQSLAHDNYFISISKGSSKSDPVTIIPSLKSYGVSFETSQPGLQTENVSGQIYSVPQILPHSVITTSKSEHFIKESKLMDNSMSIRDTRNSISFDAIHLSLQTQTIPSAEISVFSSNVEYSIDKIDALDLSLLTEELPFLTLEYSSIPEIHSTMIKQPRSIEIIPKDGFSSKFEMSYYDSHFPTYKEEITVNPTLHISASQSISNEFDTELYTDIPPPPKKSLETTANVSESLIHFSKKSKDPSSEESALIISASFATSEFKNYGASSSTIMTSLISGNNEPQSIETDIPVHKPSFLLTPVLSSFSKSGSLYSSLNTIIYPSSKEPTSIESELHRSIDKSLHSIMLSPTKPSHETSISLNGKEPESIESDHPKPKSTLLATTLLSSSYASLASVKSEFQSLVSISKVKEPKSIESEHPSSRYFPPLEATPGILPSKSLISSSYYKSADPLSIESDHPKPRIPTSSHTPFVSRSTTFLSTKPHFEVSSPVSQQFRPSSVKASSTFSLVFSSHDLRPTWSEMDSTTPDETVLVPVSSFWNVNQTTNSSLGGSSRTNEKSQEDESMSTSGDQSSPTDRTILFKDNHYWVQTVLEAPVKGHLPENFSHTMELRLSNAFSEAFRLRASRNNTRQKMVVVKILSLTEDLLQRQLEIVYVVEHGGALVPADTASEYLSFLRFEQLREFLGHHVIVKARPYQPLEQGSSPADSTTPVLAIIGAVLGSLLLLFCCLCLYCCYCRPKPVPSTPESSTSGSLQRSLSKYGQHNRKHLFREMTHQLTTEMAAQMKQGSSAPDTYLAEKRAAGRSLPTLPRDREAADPAMKILKILENKDASTSPVAGMTSRMQDNDTSTSEKTKTTPKPRRRRKIKDSHEQSTKNVPQPESPPPTPPPKGDVSLPTPESRQSTDSGTSSRRTSSQPSSPSEKSTESEGSNVELLPPDQNQSEEGADPEEGDASGPAVETQLHLSRVRQRIAELLDDAFALAGGRKIYGSLRSKKVEPSADACPRFGSFRSQSAIGGDYTNRPRAGSSIPLERRPMTEGGQRLLGVITDEGQLITHPPPKLVWEQDEGAIVREVIEARNLNLYPFHQVPSTSSAASIDALPESSQHEAALAATLRDAASELQMARSTRMNPAVVGQYDEIDIASALRNGEPVEELIKAIKDELMRFSGSFPGEDSESHA